MKIYIAVIRTRYDKPLWMVELSEQDLLDRLEEFCRKWWSPEDLEGNPPHDPQLAIDAYFEQMGERNEEFLDKAEIEIPGVLFIRDGGVVKLYQDFGKKGYKPDKSGMALLGDFIASVAENGETYLESIWPDEGRRKIVKVEVVDG